MNDHSAWQDAFNIVIAEELRKNEIDQYQLPADTQAALNAASYDANDLLAFAVANSHNNTSLALSYVKEALDQKLPKHSVMFKIAASAAILIGLIISLYYSLFSFAMILLGVSIALVYLKKCKRSKAFKIWRTRHQNGLTVAEAINKMENTLNASRFKSANPFYLGAIFACIALFIIFPDITHTGPLKHNVLKQLHNRVYDFSQADISLLEKAEARLNLELVTPDDNDQLPPYFSNGALSDIYQYITSSCGPNTRLLEWRFEKIYKACETDRDKMILSLVGLCLADNGLPAQTAIQFAERTVLNANYKNYDQESVLMFRILLASCSPEARQSAFDQFLKTGASRNDAVYFSFLPLYSADEDFDDILLFRDKLSQNDRNGDAYLSAYLSTLSPLEAAERIQTLDDKQKHPMYIQKAGQSYTKTDDRLMFIYACARFGISPSTCYPDGFEIDLDIVKIPGKTSPQTPLPSEPLRILAITREEKKPEKSNWISGLFSDKQPDYKMNNRSKSDTFTLRLETSFMDKIPYEYYPKTLEECTVFLYSDTVYVVDALCTRPMDIYSSRPMFFEVPTYSCVQYVSLMDAKLREIIMDYDMKVTKSRYAASTDTPKIMEISSENNTYRDKYPFNANMREIENNFSQVNGSTSDYHQLNNAYVANRSASWNKATMENLILLWSSKDWNLQAVLEEYQ